MKLSVKTPAGWAPTIQAIGRYIVFTAVALIVGALIVAAAGGVYLLAHGGP